MTRPPQAHQSARAAGVLFSAATDGPVDSIEILEGIGEVQAAMLEDAARAVEFYARRKGVDPATLLRTMADHIRNGTADAIDTARGNGTRVKPRDPLDLIERFGQRETDETA